MGNIFSCRADEPSTFGSPPVSRVLMPQERTGVVIKRDGKVVTGVVYANAETKELVRFANQQPTDALSPDNPPLIETLKDKAIVIYGSVFGAEPAGKQGS
ncbi:MAG: hypothetical protein AAF515_05100 [Pseudomonadota bacterium]